MRDKYIDDGFYRDIVQYRERFELPWHFFIDSIDESVFIYYLPEECRGLLPGTVEVLA